MKERIPSEFVKWELKLSFELSEFVSSSGSNSKQGRNTCNFIIINLWMWKWKWRWRNGQLDEKEECCADSTPGLKSITVNKRKLNNKHT